VDASFEGATCYVLGCVSPVAFVCASCRRACCESHGRSVSIERRAERLEQSGHPWTLQRVPTRTETYALCLRCSKRPITPT